MTNALVKWPHNVSRVGKSLRPYNVLLVSPFYIPGNKFSILKYSYVVYNFVRITFSPFTCRENQRILIETIQQENAKFTECQAYTEVFDTVSGFLLSLYSEMPHVLLHDYSNTAGLSIIVVWTFSRPTPGATEFSDRATTKDTRYS